MSNQNPTKDPKSYRSFLLETQAKVAEWPEWKRSQPALGIPRTISRKPDPPGNLDTSTCAANPFSERDVESFKTLTRFQADPEKIRVGVRQTGTLWLASVTMREDSNSGTFVGSSAHPRIAVEKALRLAAEAGLPVDLDLSRAYPHPQGKINENN